MCVRALYTGDNVVDESIGASTTGKLWQTREKEVQPACVVFLLFVSFFFLCPSPWLSFFVAADGWWAVRQRMVISRFHLSVCVWCSTKRTQTKSLRRHTVFTL